MLAKEFRYLKFPSDKIKAIERKKVACPLLYFYYDPFLKVGLSFYVQNTIILNAVLQHCAPAGRAASGTPLSLNVMPLSSTKGHEAQEQS